MFYISFSCILCDVALRTYILDWPIQENPLCSVIFFFFFFLVFKEGVYLFFGGLIYKYHELNKMIVEDV